METFLSSETILTLAWSPDGRYIATGGRNSYLTVWDMLTKREKMHCEGHQGSIFSLAWSPDGSFFTSAGDDGTIRLWNGETGKNTLVYDKHRSHVKVKDVLWPQSDMIISGSHDKTFHLWNALTGATIDEHISSSRIVALALSPDKRLLALARGDNKISVYKVQTGQIEYDYTHHSQRINTVSWSSDGMYIASAGDDRNVQVWDVQGNRHFIHYGNQLAHQDRSPEKSTGGRSMADIIYGYFGANSGITWGYEVDNRTGLIIAPGDEPF